MTPPIGMNLFVIRGLLGKEGTLSDVIWGALPFTLTFMVGLGIVMAFPQLALLLPNLMG
jgi:TRAP-type mannitol/chloroaromatic compound transport system permease large subunit